MTAQPIIHVKDLYKEFILTHSGAASLKTALLWWKRRQIEHLHVLRGISFDIRPGECVGIIGRNGAGKSTLLSLLARIYKPTSGTVDVKGRIAPLLELGAGFHQDLSGIQNIYVNAMILGLTKKQIDERLDSIIAFSELIHHVDTPVRTFSSGMSARLGFSIAIHVDADILLVDEVLAVGDYAFKAKCNAKLEQMRASGKTILIVSHGSDDLKKVTDRCIWLQHGRIQMDDAPDRVIPEYVKNSVNTFNPEGL